MHNVKYCCYYVPQYIDIFFDTNPQMHAHTEMEPKRRLKKKKMREV